MERRRLYSELLLGIEKDDSHDRRNVKLRSTGGLVHVWDEETDPRNWCLEFVDNGGYLVTAWYADTNDLVRRVLVEAGVIAE
jgi:hypothetical protein